jgi:hypothetical protein
VQIHLLVEDLVGDPQQVCHRRLVVGLHAGEREQAGVIQQVPVILLDPVPERGLVEGAGGQFPDERVLELGRPDVVADLEESVAERHRRAVSDQRLITN